MLIIVVSLMAALAFLGFFFYEWTEIEGATAVSFADNADSIEIDAEPLFEHALEQFIVGTRDEFADSSLAGNKHSMLAGQVGRIDGQLRPVDSIAVHAGTGIDIRPRWTVTGTVFEDTDGDTIPDARIRVDSSIDDEERRGIGHLDLGFFINDNNVLVGPNAVNGPMPFNGVPDLVEYVFVDPETGESVTLEISDNLSNGNGSVSLPVAQAFYDTLILNYSRTANRNTAGQQVSPFLADPAGTGQSLLLADGTNLGSRSSVFINGSPRLPFLGTPRQGSLPDFIPGAGYTYPDINSMFLGYDSYVQDFNTDRLQPRFRVIIPSFFRPQLFAMRRDTNGVDNDGGSDDNRLLPGEIMTDVGPAGFDKVFIDGAFDPIDGVALDAFDVGGRRPVVQDTSKLVLQPHAEHRNVDGSRRFLLVPTGSTTRPYGAGEGYYGTPVADTATEPAVRSGNTDRVIGPYPFRVDVDGDAVAREMGIFSGRPLALEGQEEYELDVDADGDGVRDSLFMDLDHPIITLPDGRQVVPLFAPKIVDLDGLMNLNAHGNQDGLVAARAIRDSFPFANASNGTNAVAQLEVIYSRMTQLYDRGWLGGSGGSGPDIIALQFGNFLGRTESISWSASGTTPFEVNPMYALGVRPDELQLDPSSLPSPVENYNLDAYPFGRDMLRQFAWNAPTVSPALPNSRIPTAAPDLAIPAPATNLAIYGEAITATANMELAALMGGRIAADGQTRIPGRYGEAGQEDVASYGGSQAAAASGAFKKSKLSPTLGGLLGSSVPMAGRSSQTIEPSTGTITAQVNTFDPAAPFNNEESRLNVLTGSDDDFDGTDRFDAMRRREAGQAYISPFLAGLTIPPDVHPYPGRPLVTPYVKDLAEVVAGELRGPRGSLQTDGNLTRHSGKPYANLGQYQATAEANDDPAAEVFDFEATPRQRNAVATGTPFPRGVPIDAWNTVDWGRLRNSPTTEDIRTTLPPEMRWPIYRTRVQTASAPDNSNGNATQPQNFGRTYFLHPFVMFRQAGQTDAPGVRTVFSQIAGTGGAESAEADPSGLVTQPGANAGDPERPIVNVDAEAPYGVNPLWLAQQGRLAQVVRGTVDTDPAVFSSPMFSLPIASVNEADEQILDPDYRDPRVDGLFPPSEIEGLHLSDNDFARLGDRSRLRDLAPLALEASSRAGEMRRRFTTDSWDRLEHGLNQSETRLVTGPDDGSLFPNLYINATGVPFNLGSSTFDLDSDGTVTLAQDGTGDAIVARQKVRHWETGYWLGRVPTAFDTVGTGLIINDQNDNNANNDIYTNYLAAPLRVPTGGTFQSGGQAFVLPGGVAPQNAAVGTQTFLNFPYSAAAASNGNPPRFANTFAGGAFTNQLIEPIRATPPEFGTFDDNGTPNDGTDDTDYADAHAFGPDDPFRPELRRLIGKFETDPILAGGRVTNLAEGHNSLERLLLGRRLELNGLLADGISPLFNGADNDSDGDIQNDFNDHVLLPAFEDLFNPVNGSSEPNYRELTPHVAFDPAAPRPTPSGNYERRMLHLHVPYQVNGATNNGLPPRLVVKPNTITDTDLPLDGVPYPLRSVAARVNANGESTGNAIDLDAQEWYARYDRQRLARDIYVLLYTYGGTDRFDPVNSRWLHTMGTPNPGDDRWLDIDLAGDPDDQIGGFENADQVNGQDHDLQAYTNGTDFLDRSIPRDPGDLTQPLHVAVNIRQYLQQQIQEMAQFAVNVVDQMDSDSVITRFEYDQDLSDGWQWLRNTGDVLPGSYAAAAANPSLTQGGSINYGNERLQLVRNSRVVNGIEDQQLVLTEAASVYTQAEDDDEDFTSWDDTQPQQTLHLEMRNVSPFPVDLYDGNWRLVRIDATNANDDNIITAAVGFRELNADDVIRINPGTNFTIGCGSTVEAYDPNPAGGQPGADQNDGSYTATGAATFSPGGNVNYYLNGSDWYAKAGTNFIPVLPRGRVPVQPGNTISSLSHLNLSNSFDSATGGRPLAIRPDGQQVAGRHSSYFRATRYRPTAAIARLNDVPLENSPLLDSFSSGETADSTENVGPIADRRFVIALQRRRALNQFEAFAPNLPNWQVTTSTPTYNPSTLDTVLEVASDPNASDWVEVDRIVVTPKVFDVTPAENGIPGTLYDDAFTEPVVKEGGDAPAAGSNATSYPPPALTSTEYVNYLEDLIDSRQPERPYSTHSQDVLGPSGGDIALGLDIQTDYPETHSIFESSQVFGTEPANEDEVNTIRAANRENNRLRARTGSEVFSDAFPWLPVLNRRVASEAELLSTPLYGFADPGQSPDQINRRIQLLDSYERREDLSPTSVGIEYLQSLSYDHPSIDNVNVHYVGDLFGGPARNVTWRQDPVIDPGASPTTLPRINPSPDRTAAARFQNPGGQLSLSRLAVTSPLGTTPPLYQNAWHRLLDVIALPDRTDSALTDAVDFVGSTGTQTGLENLPGEGNLRGGRDIRQRRTRRAGLVNLNGIRDREVLLGLLDDNYGHFDAFDVDGSTNEPADDRFDSPQDSRVLGRNWWDEFLLSRDGFDDFTGLPIPGTFRSRPFRTGSTVADANDPAQSSGLSAGRKNRRDGISSLAGNNAMGAASDFFSDGIPFDADGTRLNYQSELDRIETNNATGYRGNRTNVPKLGLFEARSTQDVYGVTIPYGTTNANAAALQQSVTNVDQADPDADLIDPYTRNRLLQKVLNNTTDRSHVFGMWVAVRFHEADHEVDAVGNPNTNVVRIGAVAEDLPVYRMFCVVDMSRIEQAYSDSSPGDPVNGSFNFRQFILHARRLE